jgi:hypothetical protein
MKAFMDFFAAHTVRNVINNRLKENGLGTSYKDKQTTRFIRSTDL